MNDSVGLVVYWQKNSLQYDLRAAISQESESLGIYRLLYTWDALLEIMRKEERGCGRDTACSNCVLSVLQFKVQVSGEQ